MLVRSIQNENWLLGIGRSQIPRHYDEWRDFT